MADILADMQQKRHPAATWTTNDTVLKAGEIGVESDTGKKKTGDGSTAWTSLPYDIAAYDAGDIENVPSGNLAATDVQGALDELQTDVDTRLDGSSTSRDLSDGDDVAVGDGTLAVDDLVVVKSINPLVVEGVSSGTYPTVAEATETANVAAQTVPRTPRPSSWAERFQSGHGWSIFASTAASAVDDTSDFTIGDQSYAVTTKTDGTPASVQKLSAYTIDATGSSLLLVAKISDVTNLNQFLVYAPADSFANYFLWEVQAEGGAQGWFKSGEWGFLVLNFADADEIGSPDRTNITGFRIRVGCTSTNATTLRANGLGLVPDQSRFPNGVLSFAFDDVYESTWTEARRKLSEYGFGATMYAIESRVVTDGLVTLDQCHQMEKLGWEIAGHGLTPLTSLSAGDRATHYAAVRSWLQGEGFSGADHYAYPGGQFDATIMDEMREHFTTARSIVGGVQHEHLPPADPMRLRSQSVAAAAPVASLTAEIDAAVANKSWLILTFHDLVASSPAAAQYLTSDFEAVVDYAAASGVEIRPVGAVMTEVGR